MNREEYARRRAAALIIQLRDQPVSKAIGIAFNAIYAAMSWGRANVPEELSRGLK